jgi:hypothetical protein
LQVHTDPGPQRLSRLIRLLWAFSISEKFSAAAFIRAALGEIAASAVDTDASASRNAEMAAKLIKSLRIDPLLEFFKRYVENFGPKSGAVKCRRIAARGIVRTANPHYVR